MLDFTTEHGIFTDKVYTFIMIVSLVSFILVIGAMFLFIIKYRFQEGRKTPRISHNNTLEILWTVGPVPLLCLMFFWGYQGYIETQQVTENNSEIIDIYVTGAQWYWNFQYENGYIVSSLTSYENKGADSYQENGKEIRTPMVILPKGKKIRLNITASDVIHSFAVPSFSIKRDAIKNQVRTLEFIPNKEGKYLYTCNEMCGTGHSRMLGYIRVVSPEEFEKFLVENKPSSDPIEVGKALYNNQCKSCHSIKKDVDIIGPTWYGLFPADGKLRDKEINKKDGTKTTIAVDHNYITKAIRLPAEEIAIKEYGADTGKPYPAIMPGYNLSNDEINGIIKYMKSLNKK